MIISAFITHKKSERYSDCQDRFSVNKDNKSIAVSDGMSQSYQQKIWASLLVESFTSGSMQTITEETFDTLRAKWHKKVLKFIDNLQKNPGQEYLVRMNKNSVAQRRSAAATLLGIRFDGYKWEGVVLGDTCLIELDDKNSVQAIHSSQDKEFDNYPDYIDSTTIHDKQKGQFRKICGELRAGHKILLVSDPFSNIFQDFKNGKTDLDIDELLNLKTHEEFCALVERWRAEKGMTNDDSTLVIVTHDSSEEFNIAQLDDINDLISKEKNSQKAIEDVTDLKKDNIPSGDSMLDNETKKPEGQDDVVPKPSEVDQNLTETEEENKNDDLNSAEDASEELIQEIVQYCCPKGKWYNRKHCKRNRDRLENKLREIVSKFYISKRKQ